MINTVISILTSFLLQVLWLKKEGNDSFTLLTVNASTHSWDKRFYASNEKDPKVIEVGNVFSLHSVFYFCGTSILISNILKQTLSKTAFSASNILVYGNSIFLNFVLQDWTLQISYPKQSDEGLYECQIFTEPKTTSLVQLQLIGNIGYYTLFHIENFRSTTEHLK